MITVPQGERLECFRMDGQFVGTLTLNNTKPNKYLINQIQAVAPLKQGQITHKIFKQCPIQDLLQGSILKLSLNVQTNAKLQVLIVDLTDQNFNKSDVKSLASYFDTYSNSSFVQKIKIEIITIDQNQMTKQSNIINQSISLSKNIEESIYHQQEFTYEQNAVQRKNEQMKQQQNKNPITNSDPFQSVSRVSASEQKYLTSTTFQQIKQTPSKQSSNSQNNLPLDYLPPKPQSYPHQPQQPKLHNYQAQDFEEDPQIQRLNLRLNQLQIELNKQQEELQNNEKEKTLLLNQEMDQNQGQIFVSVQHIFFSALFCFLIGYVPQIDFLFFIKLQNSIISSQICNIQLRLNITYSQNMQIVSSQATDNIKLINQLKLYSKQQYSIKNNLQVIKKSFYFQFNDNNYKEKFLQKVRSRVFELSFHYKCLYSSDTRIDKKHFI
ncbi:unnamed protein product (macronuclear) [Paramecium tetraurelia]|uniref:Transmembrane protein n=1 Tax=Paramecium tetraurelia TaxID=5888 RepID=A0CFR7_PARTE|nr:uncharacterized protein GSPATT00038075001 [Paramecium tetraurelia]CAK69634.1 unnamed protein product [Paramecium tetraurelia]|eukprot:XP_001437031.1 hypothetical protein (macronuclear) [Paramecium tetraurelia strain d4-2]